MNRYDGLTGDALREAIKRDEEAAEARYVQQVRARGEMVVRCRQCGADNVVSVRRLVDNEQEVQPWEHDR